jgi:hypothetical protein
MTVVYAEGNRQAVVEVEPGNGLAVYAQSIREWSPPHDDDPFTASDRQRILTRVLDGLRHLGVDVISA